MTDIVQRVISKAMSSVRMAFRAVLTNINSNSPIQLIQADGLAGEQLQDNELMQHYGFTSAPLNGTKLIVLPIGGKTAHGIVIATEHTQYRLKALKKGEVALYDDQGQQIILTRSGIVIKGAGLPIRIQDTPSITTDTPLFHMTGNLQVDGDIFNSGNVTTQGNNSVQGNITAQGEIIDHGNKSMSGMRDQYNDHHHGGSPAPDRNM
ncbi:phage baseplate assembly protein V [Undibacterium sp. SXout11W]|uniref:phage baseplate assembly protein V n=1 Tax=Undibacterium sp. SXout11W TaxID=3413050 RepID=UPI003BF0E91E